MSLIVASAREDAVAVMIAIITRQMQKTIKLRVRFSLLRSFIFACCSGVRTRAGSPFLFFAGFRFAEAFFFCAEFFAFEACFAPEDLVAADFLSEY